MNDQQVRFILRSWRAGGQDQADPRFEEALLALEQDPELAAWFERELALDRVIATKLQSAAVPGERGPAWLPKELASQPAPRTPEKVRVARRSWMAWAAALAVLAIALSLGLNGLNRARPAANADRFRADMTAFLNAGFDLEWTAHDPAALHQWLVSRPALSGTRVPEALKALPGIGCRTLAWAGRPVGLLCYSDDRYAVHLFVLNPPKDFDLRSIMAGAVSAAAGWQTAVWADDGLVYLLARRGQEPDLKRLLDRSTVSIGWREKGSEFAIRPGEAPALLGSRSPSIASAHRPIATLRTQLSGHSFAGSLRFPFNLKTEVQPQINADKRG